MKSWPASEVTGFKGSVYAIKFHVVLWNPLGEAEFHHFLMPFSMKCDTTEATHLF